MQAALALEPIPTHEQTRRPVRTTGEFMRIRSRLLLLILSILLPAFVIASCAVWYVYKNAKSADLSTGW